MRLGGNLIRETLEAGRWKAYRGSDLLDVTDLNIGPNSVDVTLGDQFLLPRPKGTVVDVTDPGAITCVKHAGPYVIAPGELVLATVRERFDCTAGLCLGDDRPTYFVSQIDGRSTVGRIGLLVHVTAGFGDYGFDGAYTLEIFNLFPAAIKLLPGMRIAQVSWLSVEGPSVYHGAYQGPEHRIGPVAPRLGHDRFF